MASKFSVLFLVGFVAAVVVAPYMMTEARYLPTRGNDDRLTRLKELLTDVSNYYVSPFGLKKKMMLITSSTFNLSRFAKKKVIYMQNMKWLFKTDVYKV